MPATRTRRTKAARAQADVVPSAKTRTRGAAKSAKPTPAARKPASTAKPASSSTTSKPSRRGRPPKATTQATQPPASPAPAAPAAHPAPHATHAPHVAHVPHAPLNPVPTSFPPTRPAADVFIWGKSGFGQLGLGPDAVDDVLKPRKHPWVAAKMASGAFGDAAHNAQVGGRGEGAGAGIVSVVAGGMHTYLVDEKGALWSAGVNDNGALGRKHKSEDEPAGTQNASLVLESEFGVVQALLDEGFRVVRVVAGDSFGCALNDKGQLRSWGSFKETDGETFFSPHTEIQRVPTAIPIYPTSTSSTPLKIASISAGENHILALTATGEIYSWGAGSVGQLGRCGTRILPRHRGIPQKVILGSPRENIKAVYIGTGMRSSFAIDTKGWVWAWGANFRGQLGLGALVEDELWGEAWGQAVAEPMRVETVSPSAWVDSGRSDLWPEEKVVQIAGGEFHTLFLTSEGRVLACGANDSCELGLPADHKVFTVQHNNYEPTFFKNSVCLPVELPSFPRTAQDKVVSISCNMRCNRAITQEGALYSWGTGELGFGRDEDGEDIEIKETPTVVVRNTGPRRALAVSSGGQHAVALLQAR